MGRRSQPPPETEPVPIEEAQVRYDLGIAYIEMGLRRDALAEFEAALRIDPLHDRAQDALAKIERLRQELGLPPGKLPQAKA
jgi:Tfp pilus assembly protein PilF